MPSFPCLKTSIAMAALSICTYGALTAPAAAQVAGAGSPASPSAQAAAVNSNAVVAHYARLVHNNYTDTLASAQQLRNAMQAFTAAPSAQALADARKAWLAAREFYGQTEAFRFYGGPMTTTTAPRAASTPGRWTNRLWTAWTASRVRG